MVIHLRLVARYLITAASVTLVTGDMFRVSYLSMWRLEDENAFAAVPMALENYLADHAGNTLLDQHEFELSLISRQGANHEVDVNVALISRAKEGQIDAVLGPLYSTSKADHVVFCRSSTWVLNHWKIPIFAESSSDPYLANKTKYPNLSRLLTPYDKLGRGALEIMKMYNWRISGMLTRNSGLCDYGASAIASDLLDNGYELTPWIRHGYIGNMPLDVIDEYLRRISEKARIIWICNSEPDTVNIMLRAQALGMNTGDYVFIVYERQPYGTIDWNPWQYGIEDQNLTAEEYSFRREAFYPLKMISPAQVNYTVRDEFLHEVSYRLHTDYNISYTWETTQLAWIYAMFLHDCMYLYLTALDSVLAEGGDAHNGNLIFEKAKRRRFLGKSGQVTMDDNGDREPDWELWFNGPGINIMTPWLRIEVGVYDNVTYTELGPVPYWVRADNQPPPDVPPCGFLGELCPEDNSTRNLLIGCITGGVVILIGTLIVYMIIKRQRALEAELQQMLWRIRHEDVKELSSKQTGSTAGLSMNSLRSEASRASMAHELEEDVNQIFTSVGIHKGVTVAIRHIDCHEAIHLSREHLLELKVIREMNHENINGFIGACIEPPHVCIVTQYCPKGSLQDKLENDVIKLDWMFKCSLINDIASGMQYIHQTALSSHGHLRSSTCLVDSRWQIKITSYGLHFLKQHDEAKKRMSEYQKYRRQLWSAPELLRLPEYQRQDCGTRAGDVYSFAIVVQEILYRALPYFMESMSPKDIVERVAKVGTSPFRPEVPANNGGEEEIDDNMVELMKTCWSEQPDERPDFNKIKKKLKAINNGSSFNIMDNMIGKLEKYASNLETIVEQRTGELLEETKKTDALLYRMLPPSVAEDLKVGKSVKSEMFDEATIYFSDIVGFTAISAASTPIQIVDLLNDLYTLFDDIIDQHDVYKVETIGDAYMVASGLPKRNGDRHSGEIANMSMDLLNAVYTKFKIRHRPDLQMRLRIGLHTGSTCAGVVGLTMPRYCLFGDTVTIASKMESGGLPLRIHISLACKQALGKLGIYHMQEREEMVIKGRVKEMTYWLTGREGYTRVLPPMDNLED